MHRKDIIAKSLPIGERKRLEITRSMATRPELLLLDETAAGLTPTEVDVAIDLIKKIRDCEGTIEFNGERIDNQKPCEIIQHGIVHVPEGRQFFTEMSTGCHIIGESTSQAIIHSCTIL